jgi:hypothetical protein
MDLTLILEPKPAVGPVRETAPVILILPKVLKLLDNLPKARTLTEDASSSWSTTEKTQPNRASPRMLQAEPVATPSNVERLPAVLQIELRDIPLPILKHDLTESALPNSMLFTTLACAPSLTKFLTDNVLAPSHACCVIESL